MQSSNSALYELNKASKLTTKLNQHILESTNKNWTQPEDWFYYRGLIFECIIKQVCLWHSVFLPSQVYFRVKRRTGTCTHHLQYFNHTSSNTAGKGRWEFTWLPPTHTARGRPHPIRHTVGNCPSPPLYRKKCIIETTNGKEAVGKVLKWVSWRFSHQIHRQTFQVFTSVQYKRG